MRWRMRLFRRRRSACVACMRLVNSRPSLHSNIPQIEIYLLRGEQGSPEGALVCGYETGFLGWQRRNQRLEIGRQWIEFLPRRRGGTIGRAKFGEIGPVVLHGGGELELGGSEWRARDGDG